MRVHLISLLLASALSQNHWVKADDGANTTANTDTNTTGEDDADIPGTIFEDEEAWSGCVDPKNPGAKVEIGKKTTVCLHIGNNVNWAAGVDYTRVSFKPEADQYSRVQIPRSFDDLVVSAPDTIFNEKDIVVGTASQSGLSFLKVYYDFETGYIYPYLTAVIDVRDGVVKGITWDDACVFCGTSSCDEITYNYDGVLQNQSSSGQHTKGCRLTEGQCNVFSTDEDDETTCDLTLYVVWTGTDANRVAFQSSAFRFSQFPPQEIQDRLSHALTDRRRNLEEAKEVFMSGML